jgi:hypothetical protein
MSRLLIIGSQASTVDARGFALLRTRGCEQGGSPGRIRTGLLSDSLAHGSLDGIKSTDEASATEAPTVHGWPSAGEQDDHAQ